MWETWGGWLAGWGVQGGRDCRGGGGSLGSGATRTLPPPWPPRGLPPPVGRSRRARSKTPRPGSHLLRSGAVLFLTSTHLVGLGLSVLRVVFLVCLCLCVLLRLLGLLVLLLVVHSLFFLQGRQNGPSTGGRTLTHDLRPLLCDAGSSLTFAAFLAFGSGLGGAGLCEDNGKRIQ